MQPTRTNQQETSSSSSTNQVPLKWTEIATLKNSYAKTTIEYKLSSILHDLRTIHVVSTSNVDYNTINFKNTRALHFSKTISLPSLFKNDQFASRFADCWPSYTLDQLTGMTLESSRIPGVTIRIVNDIVAAATIASSKLNPIEQHAFRSIFCFFTKFYYDLNLPMCACYPQNPYEYCLYELGIGKNCYNSECRSFLSTNQQTYDSFVHTACDEAINQIAIVTLNNFFSYPTNKSRITITQTASVGT